MVAAGKGDSENEGGLACSARRWCCRFVLVTSGAGEGRGIRQSECSWVCKGCSILDNLTSVRQGTVCVLHAVSRGPMADVEALAGAIKCDNHFHERDWAHNVCSDEEYRPTDARICVEVGIVLCPALVEGCPIGWKSTSNDVHWVLCRLFEVSVCSSLLNAAQKEDLIRKVPTSRLLREYSFLILTKLAG